MNSSVGKIPAAVDLVVVGTVSRAIQNLLTKSRFADRRKETVLAANIAHFPFTLSICDKSGNTPLFLEIVKMIREEPSFAYELVELARQFEIQSKNILKNGLRTGRKGLDQYSQLLAKYILTSYSSVLDTFFDFQIYTDFICECLDKDKFMQAMENEMEKSFTIRGIHSSINLHSTVEIMKEIIRNTVTIPSGRTSFVQHKIELLKLIASNFGYFTMSMESGAEWCVQPNISYSISFQEYRLIQVATQKGLGLFEITSDLVYNQILREIDRLGLGNAHLAQEKIRQEFADWRILAQLSRNTFAQTKRIVLASTREKHLAFVEAMIRLGCMAAALNEQKRLGHSEMFNWLTYYAEINDITQHEMVENWVSKQLSLLPHQLVQKILGNNHLKDPRSGIIFIRE